MQAIQLKFNSARLAELRSAKGFTQEAFAKQVGVTRQTVNNWEKGKNSPSINEVNRISEALGVPGMFLITGKD